MSLDTVVEDIRDEAHTRAEEIRAEGEQRAEEIVEAAEADAEEIRADAEAEVERSIEQEREQKLSSAKLEAKQERLQARRELLQDVRESVEERIADLEGERREELTRALLEAAAPEFADADSVLVHGAAGDQELLATICADHDGFSVGDEVDCLGGVVVESEGSRVRVNNTFDSVLEEVWEENLRGISERLLQER
jgi:V/A-type H+-transporting ATPase subunit E